MGIKTTLRKPQFYIKKKHHLAVLRFLLERVRGIEPLSSVWKTEIITIIRYPRERARPPTWWSGTRDSNPEPLGPKPSALAN